MKFVILAMCLLALAGCASNTPKFIVSVDGLAPHGAEKGLYYLFPGNDGESEDNLQFIEFSGYVEKALSYNGFERTLDKNKADIAILFSYGISDPQEYEYTYSVPNWGQTGVNSSTYGNGTIGNSSIIYNSTTTQTPIYGVTGYSQRTGVAVSFLRHANLIAYDYSGFRESGELTRTWSTFITSGGFSGDLRRVMPVMLGGSIELIGKNTGQRVDLQLKENNKKVKLIKGLLDDS